MRKRENLHRKKKIIIPAVLLAVFQIMAGCGKSPARVQEDNASTIAEAIAETQSPSAESDNAEISETAAQPKETAAPEEQPDKDAGQDKLSEETGQAKKPAEGTPEPEVLGDPRSSFGLGSAPFLKGKNVLVSLFVTTPESGWTEKEKEKMLAKMKIAADYIESQALSYGVGAELIYDWKSESSLLAEADTDFCINEDTDFMDRLDEEIVRWFGEKISYEDLLEQYDAQGIATCIFVNNPGISYAIVYDGTDNEQESIILFSGDYYKQGSEETPAVYAHEILHVFGAHDLYEDAEFTKDATDYIGRVYPDELMYTVSGSGQNKIDKILSPVTAYHLGWIDDTEEIRLFPQLDRN